MPAGGTWQSQNKVRPGAYINVVGVPKPLGSIGDRGVVAIVMEPGWGEQLTRMSANEFLTGAGLYKIGANYTDDSDVARQLRLVFQGAASVIIRRSNTGQVKASATIASGTCTATAKYAGTFGNNISLKVTLNTTSTEDDPPVVTLNSVTVETYVNGVLKAKLTSADKTAFSNDWVDISASALSSFVAGDYSLSGGTNGSADSLTNVFADLEQENWNTLAFPATSSTDKDAAVAFVKSLRDDCGIKVQAVVTECTGTDANGYTFASYAPDYEGIYVCKQGYRLSDATVVSPIDEVYMLAGMIAGATITESLTGTVIPNAIEVLHGPKTNADIIDAINTGKLVLSKRRDGAIVIEYDVNSFTSLTAKKGKVFTKGRPVRVMDNIANDIKGMFDKTYLGKVSNDEDGRGIFKANIIKYMNDLQKMGAVQNFDSETDIEVIAGDDTDAVVVGLWVQPVDSMEKLYMTVNVWG